MKKKYESPIAEKYEFNYLENVVASNFTTQEIITGGQNGNPHANENSCYTGNGSDKGNGNGNGNCKGKNK